MFACSLKELNRKTEQKFGQEYALKIAAFWFVTPCRLTEYTLPLSLYRLGMNI
jgi:hypothetical protein